MGKGKIIAAGLAGAAVGATAGVLFAPKSGAETRKELAVKFNEVLDKAKNLKKEDALEYIENTIDKVKKEIESLDKETVLKKAQKKSDDIQKQLKELVAYAKDKGNEELTKATEALRKKALQVSKDVVKKLEETK